MKSHVMKRRLLVFSLLTVPVMASAQPPEWQTVVGSDLRFRLEMPAPAATSSRTLMASLPRVAMRSPCRAWSQRAEWVWLPSPATPTK